MLKKITGLTLCCLTLLTLLCGCSPSPTAVQVGSRKVDASEYAFYLYYNRTNTDAESGTVLYEAKDTETAREIALDDLGRVAPAERCLVRELPVSGEKNWDFAMVKCLDPGAEKTWDLEGIAYLGLAFD